MTTPLTSLASIKTIFEVAPGDSSQDAVLNLYLTEATQVICDYCGVSDFGLVTYTEMYSGNNSPTLILRQIPATGLTLTGTLISGSAVVTGLATTANLFASQSVRGTGIPDSTTVLSVDSSTQITLSNKATASGSPSLTFGVALWLDTNAFAGSAPGAFDSTTLLSEGGDYYLDYDNGPGGICNSGLVYRIGYFWISPPVWEWGLITPQGGPPTHNVRVKYNAGYASIPASLAGACELLVAKMRLSGKTGQGIQSMSAGGLSASLGTQGTMGLLTPEITSVLSRYRKVIL